MGICHTHINKIIRIEPSSRRKCVHSTLSIWQSLPPRSLLLRQTCSLSHSVHESYYTMTMVPQSQARQVALQSIEQQQALALLLPSCYCCLLGLLVAAQLLRPDLLLNSMALKRGSGKLIVRIPRLQVSPREKTAARQNDGIFFCHPL